jgi:Flp pilus assembly protein TadG
MTAKSRKSRGNSLVLTAVLLPILIGLVALAVDIAVLATARAQLKTVADGAALAGAFQLADENRVRGATELTSEINNAQTRAQTTGQANLVLGKAAVITGGSSGSSGDVVVGFVDPVSHKWTPPPLSNVLQTNSVQVNATRSSDHGGLVPGFFSRALGFSDTKLTVTSTATVQNYTVTGYKTVNNQNVNLLPIVLDQVTYYAMLTNNPLIVTDQFNYNTATGAVSSGPDGVYESKLYPVSSGDPGNWGTVKIGVSNNSTATLSDQIQYGITPDQMANYPNSTISLTGTPPSITWVATRESARASSRHSMPSSATRSRSPSTISRAATATTVGIG